MKLVTFNKISGLYYIYVEIEKELGKYITYKYIIPISRWLEKILHRKNKVFTWKDLDAIKKNCVHWERL